MKSGFKIFLWVLFLNLIFSLHVEIFASVFRIEKEREGNKIIGEKKHNDWNNMRDDVREMKLRLIYEDKETFEKYQTILDFVEKVGSAYEDGGQDAAVKAFAEACIDLAIPPHYTIARDGVYFLISSLPDDVKDRLVESKFTKNVEEFQKEVSSRVNQVKSFFDIGFAVIINPTVDWFSQKSFEKRDRKKSEEKLKQKKNEDLTAPSNPKNSPSNAIAPPPEDEESILPPVESEETSSSRKVKPFKTFKL